MTTETHSILPLASLKPGMRLAEPIRDRLGHIMLAQGTELTEAHLASLDQRGIASAMVHLEGIPPTNEEIDAMRQAIEGRLRQIFRKTLDLPDNRALFDVILSYRLKQLK